MIQKWLLLNEEQFRLKVILYLIAFRVFVLLGKHVNLLLRKLRASEIFLVKHKNRLKAYLKTSRRFEFQFSDQITSGPPTKFSPRRKTKTMDPTRTAAWKVSVIMTAFIPPWKINNVRFYAVILFLSSKILYYVYNTHLKTKDKIQFGKGRSLYECLLNRRYNI